MSIACDSPYAPRLLFHMILYTPIGPVPTPPTSARTTETAGSDHGTTIHVNIPSATSQREQLLQISQEEKPIVSQSLNPVGAFQFFISFISSC